MKSKSKQSDIPYALLFWIVIGLLIGVSYVWSSGTDNSGVENKPAATSEQPTNSSSCSYEGCVEDEIDQQKYEDYKDEQLQKNEAKTTCVDVTSYDYNWDNDVKCTKPDGTVFYTDYAGGRQYGL